MEKPIIVPGLILATLLLCVPFFSSSTQADILWEIGVADNKSNEFALAPGNYKQFLEHDFGWEDGAYVIGHSSAKTDFPYVLPGPMDGWGGTAGLSGIRSHVLNILFGLKTQDFVDADAEWKLVIDIRDCDVNSPPLLKVLVNGKAWQFRLLGGKNSGVLKGEAGGQEQQIVIPIGASVLRHGGNEIQLTSIDGRWLVFDQLRLEGPGGVELERPEQLFIRHVDAADYEIESNGTRVQALLVDVEHLSGEPHIAVKIDGQDVFSEVVEAGRYSFEVPMPAVKAPRQSDYEILVNGKLAERGVVQRSSQAKITAADYVDTRMGVGHSRWMIAPGPWMPFGMVKLSPDNQNSGWQGGYDPTIESIGAFSHIHEWTMAGLGMLPANGPLRTKVGDQKAPDSGYRSRIDKASEQAPLGYYSVLLSDYDIRAELTATTRGSFQRYTYPPDKGPSRVMIDLKIPAERNYTLDQVELKKVSDYRIEGFSRQYSRNTWAMGVHQEYTVHFVIEFDQPIRKFRTWRNNIRVKNRLILRTKRAGAYVEFDTRNNPVVQVRTGISYVSIENASQNLKHEISEPFGWDFEAVRKQQRKTWNSLLERVAVRSNDRREKVRFYSNMYRSYASRNTFSDVDGSWVDAEERIQRFDDPDRLALSGDAFWNTFWNLNQLWNLVTPEWSSLWVKSQLAMYEANGWLAKGPAGMEYVPVMVAEHEIPFIVGAYQMGICDYDVEQAFEAVYKMQTTPAQKVGHGLAGNRDLPAYLEYQYVPYDEGRFSNTLEYSFDDWAVAQFASATGKTEAYNEFIERSAWWKNVIDRDTGFARLKNSKGEWESDFDPFKSGANEDYVEGNAWQLSFFVPHDVAGLVSEIGEDRFYQRLQWGFEESEKWRYNAPNELYWDFPVIHGNQQSMHFAYLFNWAGRPWLTQQWSRSVMERYYGYGVSNAYLGDEDQGQMSAWLVMSSLGLFQTDGGTRVEPIYEIGSPLFQEVHIDLGERYGRGKSFTIEAINTSRKNIYVQSATLNDKPLSTFWFPASELLKGGKLVLEMGKTPNKNWGTGAMP